MATKKISELEAITEADDSDVLAIVDVSEGKTNKITKNNLLIGAGHSIEMSLNQETYALTLTLKNAAGTELSRASIDLPNENSITDISYNNGKLTLTKQSGTTTEVDITGLINGLATETALNNLANALKETIGIQTNTYDNTKTYNTGDIVVQNEKIYKANQDEITGTFDSSKWDELSLYEYQKIQDEAIEENYKVITKLQEDVEDLTERVEDAEKNQLTNTPEIATSHYLQDSADSRFRKFIPIGRTTQESTTGKNKIDYTKVKPGSATSDTVTLIENGFKVVGKFAGQIVVEGLKENTSYYLSYIRQIITGSTTAIAIYAGTTQSTTVKNLSGNGTFNTGNNTTVNIWFYVGDGTNSGEANFTNIQLEEGTVATAYEPYTGGQPAPNPNYEMPINNTGDNVNLFDRSLAIENAAIVWTTGETYTTNGSLTSDFIQVTKGLSIVQTYVSQVCFYDINKNYLGCLLNNNLVTSAGGEYDKFTIPNNDNIKYMRLGYRKSTITGIDLLTAKIKVEKGTKATPYSPYGCGNVNEKVQNKNFLTNLEASANTTVTNGVVTQTSADTRSDLQWKIQTYNGTTKVEELPIIVKNTIGIFSRTFTKNGTFNRIRFGLNGSQRDTLVISDVSNLPDGEYKLVYNITNVTQGSISWKDIMITKATETDLTYQAHSEQNISFPLAEGQKFYEGSYPDDDEKVHHVRKKFTLDGSQLMSKFIYNSNLSTTNYNCFLYDDNEIKQATNDTEVFVLADKLKGTPSNQRTSDMANCWINHLSAGQLGMHVPNTITNTTELRTWLTENPITFEVLLAEEQTEDFTEEQKTAWKEWQKARTYKNVTHISSEDETPANVEVEYVQDTKTYIDNKVTALTNAIISLGGNI